MWKKVVLLGTLLFPHQVIGEELRACAAYLPEGWWDVPPGSSPQVISAIETGGMFSEGGFDYDEVVIITAPTPLAEPVFDDDGFPKVLYFGDYLTALEVENLLTKLFCGPVLTS